MFRSILKNSSYLFVAQLLIKFISFLYTLFLASSLGVEGFGLYIVALSYFSLISSISEFGINRYLVREISLDRSKIGVLLCSVIIFRLTITSLVFCVFAAGLYYFDPDKVRASVVLLGVMAVLPQAIGFSLDSSFVATSRILWSSLGLLVLKLATTTIGFLLIKNDFGVFGAVAALLLGQIIYIVFLTILPIKHGFKYIKNQLSDRYVIDLSLLKEMSVGSLPYGLLGILGLIYFRIDSLMLSYMKGSYEVGVYGAAYKFLEALVFVPSAVATVMFPIIAKLHQNDLSKVKELYWKSVKFLLALSVFIFLAYIILLPEVIKQFLPQYQQSIGVLKILAFTIPFMFAHIPGAMVLQASDKYLRLMILLSALTVGSNIAGNYILIPVWGVTGAAYTTVFSEILSFVVFYLLLWFKVLRRVT